MKESDLWKVVFSQVSLKHVNLYELPLPQIDIILEREFLEVRKLQIVDEDLHT